MACVSRRSEGRTGLRDRRGFTLTELLVVLSIAGGVAAVGAPSLASMLATQQVRTATFDFYAALVYARSQAIERRAVVAVLPRGGNFGKGWDIQLGDNVLSSNPGSDAVAITTPAELVLAYGKDGRLTSTTRYQFAVTATRSAQVRIRCVDVDLSGRPAIRVDANGDGNCNND